MSNIEKDIKFIEKMIKEYKTFGDLHNPDYEDTERIYKALENILSAYRNSIPKQKIKNILDNNYRVLYEGDAENPDNAIEIHSVKYIKAEVLQELLQESEE